MIKRKLLSMTLVIVMIASMFSFGAMTAAGAPENYTDLNINYDSITETFYGDPGLVYAVLRGTTDADWARARWIPFIGELNISRMIPRRDNPARRPVIAFANTNEAVAFGTAAIPATGLLGSFTPESRITVTLVGRKDAPKRGDAGMIWFAPGIDALVMGGAAPTALVPATATNIIGGNQATGAAYDIDNFVVMAGRAGTNGWTRLANILGNYGSIGQSFPMGGTLEVRSGLTAAERSAWSWIEEDPADPTNWNWIPNPNVGSNTNITSVDNAVRVRIPTIPRAPRAPRITAASPTSVIALTDRMEIAVVQSVNDINDPDLDWMAVPAGARLLRLTSASSARVPNTVGIITREGIATQATFDAADALRVGDIILVRMAATSRARTSWPTAVQLVAANGVPAP
jgi:hypothetical protein